MEIAIRVDGMTCGGCKAAVEKVLAAQAGVAAVTVDLAAGLATVRTSGNTTPETLVAAVERAGYDARVSS